MDCRDTLQKYFEVIVGQQFTDLHLACEMMMLTFGEYALHTQCLTRIIHENDILVTTLDYQNWDEIDDKNNDEWQPAKGKPVIVTVDAESLGIENGTYVKIHHLNNAGDVEEGFIITNIHDGNKLPQTGQRKIAPCLPILFDALSFWQDPFRISKRIFPLSTTGSAQISFPALPDRI